MKVRIYIPLMGVLFYLRTLGDADHVIDKMMKSKNWSNNKYYGKSKENQVRMGG